MESRNLIRILVVVSLCLVVPAAFAGQQSNHLPSAASLVVLSGQTATLLPDGTLLLAGGQDAAGRVTGSLRIRDAQGQERELATTLRIPRAAHTATVLPDGTVLVAGGVGADGQAVKQAELFDPLTKAVQLLDAGAPTPRAFHSATLLTDGRVLLAGGTAAGGEVLDSAELWDYRLKTSVAITGRMTDARWGHTAALLPDGTVFLSGGKGADGNSLSTSNIFDPQTQTFLLVAAPNSAQYPGDIQALSVEASFPQDGARDVAVDVILALRFSRPLNVGTVSPSTVLLKNSTGVTVTVVPAEGGMLVFITPSGPLEAGVTYTLTLRGLADKSGQTLPETIITFTTAGADTSGGGDGSDAGLNSPWRKLPPLEAAPGMTALAGQVLKLNGDPLEHVLLEIDKKTTYTDKTGRFLLREITAGHHIMYIDGAPANGDGAVYGLYRVGVDITAGQTNVLNYTIWMTALDMEHVVRFPSPTTSEVVVTNPNIPGLELHIPPDTVIRDARGRVVTELGITPIPMRQPPFPLKRGVVFPVYFTIQPGGASFSTAGTNWSAGQAPRGAQIRYQNYPNAKPGTRFDFWNYDPAQKGWYVYGKGRVSGDQRMIIPDNGTQIWSFDGAMVSLPGNAPGSGPKGSNPNDGEPVDLQTGLFVYRKTDLMLSDVIPIVITRTYRQDDSISRAFGIGASLPYDMFMVGDSNCCGTFSEGYTYQDLVLADGGRVHFTRTSPCNGYCNYGDAVYTATSMPGEWYGATLQWGGGPVPGTAWVMKKRDGTYYYFRDSDGSSNARYAAVLGMQDRHGNMLTFTRDGYGNLLKITSPNGRWVQFTYDTSSRITQAQDNIGRTLTYTYDGSGRLWTVTNPNGGVTTYTYDANDNMLTIKDPHQIVYLTNQYDANNRVIRQTSADGAVWRFQYDLNGINVDTVTQTTVTDPRGYVRKVTFNSDGYMTSDTRAYGQPEQQTTTYERQASSGFISSVTDALNRKTAFTYDAMGNVTSITRMAATAEAVTTSFAYDPALNQLTSVTDPLNHTATITRDYAGNPTAITDALGHQVTLTYNSQGLPLTATDPQGNTMQFTIDGGDVVAVTDPAGNSTVRFVDGAGRVAALTDGLGNTTLFSYDPLNQVVQISDALSGLTSLTYDENGNLRTLTDVLNHTTTWTYDNMDRIQTRTDPLLRQESYSYDLAGNMISSTDRKNQLTSFSYDALNRPVFVGYGTTIAGGVPSYESTVSYQYDAAGRLHQTIDSLGGTITLGYDGLDRKTTETSPQGTVSYTYDAGSRRSSMTVLGQAPVSYSYDDANRLTAMSQGTQSVQFAYDDANRRTSLVLPNGLEISYGYNATSQLTGITYKLGGSVLGDLTYGYDQLGRKTQIGGSLARTLLPQPLSSAAYDIANELINWNGTTMLYDANGNMLSDGVNSFSWNSRDQLSALNGAVLQYDAFGRRTQNAAGTSFLFDGANSVQELSGTTVTANIWTGGVDEIFQRSDGSGTVFPQTDALGSTLALVDSNGVVQTSYSYDPFGNTTLTGAGSNNPSQFTGRENDGGLYYNRARYYDPAIARFVSEDPIGFDGGEVNLYAYVANDPINLIDPSGLTWTSNWNYFWDWALGRGSQKHRNYGPNDPETQEMTNSPGVNKLRDAFNRGGCKSQNNLSYDTYEAYWDTTVNPFTADWSSTAAEVGGFAGASIVNNGNGTATFTIPNTSGTHSFFLHLVPDRKSPTGPMSNIYQTFQWTEPLSGRNCGC